MLEIIIYFYGFYAHITMHISALDEQGYLHLLSTSSIAC
jgi:hypothetical protein